MKNFRTYQLAKEYYLLSLNLEFKGVVKKQFDRAVLSIVLNLAEGAGKPTLNDRRKYFFNAFGSHFAKLKQFLKSQILTRT